MLGPLQHCHCFTEFAMSCAETIARVPFDNDAYQRCIAPDGSDSSGDGDGGGATGDPHPHFAHGGRADYRGEDGAIASFFSAPGIALNVKTEDATFTPPWWPGTTIDGSYITEAHVVARVGGAKRKWANASFLSSRLTEFNTGPDFITGSCGGHAFSFGLGTKLRRCEEMSIKPHYSSAKFEAAALPMQPMTFPSARRRLSTPLPLTPYQVRGWTFTVGAKNVEGWISGPKHQLDVSIHAAGDAAARSLPHGIAGQGGATRGLV